MVVVVVTKKEQRADNVLFSECEYTDDYWDQWAEGKQLVGTGRKKKKLQFNKKSTCGGSTAVDGAHQRGATGRKRGLLVRTYTHTICCQASQGRAVGYWENANGKRRKGGKKKRGDRRFPL